jgi:hypothetical protein
MILKKWIVKNEIFYFPDKWDKSKVINFLNTDIKVCDFCGKIDINNNHFTSCNKSIENNRINNIDNYYK